MRSTYKNTVKQIEEIYKKLSSHWNIFHRPPFPKNTNNMTLHNQLVFDSAQQLQIH